MGQFRYAKSYNAKKTARLAQAFKDRSSSQSRRVAPREFQYIPFHCYQRRGPALLNLHLEVGPLQIFQAVEL